MSNVIEFINRAHHEALERSVREGSFRLFLEAISLVAESKAQDRAALAAWELLSPTEPAEKTPEIFLKWLAGLTFVSNPSPDRSPESDSTGPSDSRTAESSTEAAEMGAAVGSERGDFSRTAKSFMESPESAPFDGFYGVIPFRQFIHEPFARPLANASEIIAEHLRHLIDSRQAEAESWLQVRQDWLLDFVLEQLIPWVIASAKKAEKEEGDEEGKGQHIAYFDRRTARAWQFVPALLTGDIDLDDPDSFVDGFDPSMLPDLLLNVPQELFDRLVPCAPREIPEFHELGQEEPFLDLFDVLVTLPFKGESVTVSEFDSWIAEDSALHPIPHRNRRPSNVPKVELEVIADLVFNYSVSWLSIQYMAADGISTMAGLPFTRERLASRISILSRRIRKFRRGNLGRLPLSPDAAMLLGLGLENISSELGIQPDLDIPFLLVSSADSNMVLGYESGIGSPVLPTRREGESAHGLVLRGRLFGRAIEQARDEGLLELADALLGFYLVTQTLTDSDHDSIDWSIAGPALNEAAGRFEEGILAGCIQLAYQLSVEAPGDKSFDQGRLDYFRRSSAPAVTSFDVTKLLRMVHAERRMTADQALDKRISPKIKAALPDFVRQLLLEAENDYEHRLSRRRAESSEIDFASVVQNYFKPVELILLRTYENVSTYPGFHEFAGLNSNQSRPPIVKVINVFRRHDSLPEPVRRHLSSEGCLLGSSSEYSLEWLHEFRLLRNRAAHGGFVAQHEVESIRDNLYTHGLRCLLYGVPSKVLRTLPG